MNIVYLITRSDSIGGAHVHVRDMAQAMRERGHGAVVLVGGDGPYLEELQRSGLACRSLANLVRPVDPLRDVRALFELRRSLSELKPDLVSAHSSKAGWLGRVAARSLGLPVVFTAHGWAFTEGRPEPGRSVFRLAEKAVGRLASRIIAVSEYDRQLALKHAIAPPDTIVTIHNGMPAVDPSLQASPELMPPRLVMVARFESQKDQATLVQALSGLNQYEWSLDLVGDGPQRSAVEAAVGEAGLEGRVRFLGFRNDVPELLSQSQLFVLSSHWEGFPRTIVEAMRAGLPVIASDVGGVSEAVIDGETGCVVPPADHIALRRALEQLICDAGLREEMGARGRQRFEQQLTFDRMVEATAQLYRQLV